MLQYKQISQLYRFCTH